MPAIALPPQYGPSREWLIDQRVKELIGLYVANKRFTREEQHEYDTLTDERSGRMGARRPAIKRRSRPPLLSFFRW
jgi:hypothetical protein